MAMPNANGTAHTRSFEQYLEANDCQRIKGKKVRCGGCLRTDLKCWVRGGAPRADIVCEACLRYMFGYDQAQATTIRLIVGAAVASLDDTGDPELARAAIAEGMHDADEDRIKVLDG